MPFWNDVSVEPKRQFRFRVQFSGVGSEEATFLAQSADRPSYTISDTTKVDFLDKSFHYPGKITWNQVKIKFVDAEGALNVSSKTYSWLQGSGWINPSQFPSTAEPGKFSTINKSGLANAASPTGKIKIMTLSKTGGALDTWTLNNAWVTNAALNNLDYSAEGILTAEYTIRYDWADLT